MMNWEKLRIFYHVATLSSFTKAAEKLNTTQSGISRHVKELEETFKCILFYRDAKGISLTPKGEELLASVRNMHDEASAVESYWKGGEDVPAGELVIVTSPGIASTWLPNFIPEFLGKNPEIRFTIRANLEYQDIEGHEAHIRPHMSPQPELIQRYLTSFHMSLFASDEYIAQHGAPKTPSDLNHHKLLMFGEKMISLYGNTNWALFEGSEFKPRKPFMKVNSDSALFNFAKNHVGIAELPEEYPGLKESNLVKVLDHYPAREVKVYFIYLKHYQYSKRITAFGDFLENRLRRPV